MLCLAGCDSFTAAPYGISADNDIALKSVGAGAHVAVGNFVMTAKYDPNCRLAGPIQLPNGLTAEAYIQKAFSDELKIAGLYDESAKNRLTGSITQLEFGSASGGWDMAMTLTSTNGKSASAKEHYDFHSSFTAASACHDVADAFQPAVQGLIQQVILSPDFKALLAN
jgi:hypothetical protein